MKGVRRRDTSLMTCDEAGIPPPHVTCEMCMVTIHPLITCDQVGVHPPLNEVDGWTSLVTCYEHMNTTPWHVMSGWIPPHDMLWGDGYQPPHMLWGDEYQPPQMSTGITWSHPIPGASRGDTAHKTWMLCVYFYLQSDDDDNRRSLHKSRKVAVMGYVIILSLRSCSNK